MATELDSPREEQIETKGLGSSMASNLEKILAAQLT